MQWLTDIILDNLQVIFLISIFVLPAIFGRKKKKSPVKRMPSSPPTGKSAQADKGATLEGKVRQFFEQITQETRQPKPTAAKPRPQPAEPSPFPRSEPTVFIKHVDEEPPTLQPMDAWEETGEPDWAPPTEPATRVKSPKPKASVTPEVMDANYALRLKDRAYDVDQPGQPWDAVHKVTDYSPHHTEIKHGLHVSLKGLSRQDLRKAIVMKEILGKPKALKM
jgi:hypothetical protein